MSNDMESMRTFADQLWKYMVPKLNAMFSSNVSYFRAVVVTNLGNNMLEVQRPVEDGTLTLPCVDMMAHAQPGQQVVALVMGSLSNAIIIGDGKLNIPMSTYGPSGVVTLEAGNGGMPFNRLVSDITAVQAGSGDPSPTNIRPITGFTGINLHINDTVQSISWQTETGTVYGGTLDILTGVLTVDRIGKVFDGTESWSANGSGSSLLFRNVDSRAKASSSQRASSHFKNATITTGSTEIGYYAYTSGSRTDTYVQFRPDLSQIADVTAWKTWLAGQSTNGTPLTCWWKILNPITYQLTPNPISSLPGLNTIWSDAGDVTVEYGQFLQAMQQEIKKGEP